MTDLDVHGLVAVRMVERTPVDAGALGAFAADLDRAPDLVVGPGCTFEWDGTVLPARVLRPAVHAAALAAHAFPLHATAFVADDTAVAITGWSRSGKTAALLAFLGRGARFVAAEWCFVADGQLLPLNDAVRVRGHRVPAVGLADRSRATLLGVLARRMRRWPRIARRLDDRSAVDVDPATWGPVARGPVALDVIAFLVSPDGGSARVLDHEDAAARLAAGLRHDLAPLRAAHDEAVFRNGRRAHAVLDHLDELITSRARDAVRDVRTLLVPTSHPPDLADLHATLVAAL